MQPLSSWRPCKFGQDRDAPVTTRNWQATLNAKDIHFGNNSITFGFKATPGAGLAQTRLVLGTSYMKSASPVATGGAATRKPGEPASAESRSWSSALAPADLSSIQAASLKYTYRDIPLVKNPFDFALYHLLLWRLKPGTIIEVGSFSGGSAV